MAVRRCRLVGAFQPPYRSAGFTYRRSESDRCRVSVTGASEPSRTPPNPLALAQWRRLDTTLMTRATMTAPNKYERRAWERAILRILLVVKFVSDTWKVMPMVNAK